ncbi:MAG: head completion protein [Proteobacteria bacterium]|nr:head completion protein [Pseudomonadota bacterium]
MNNQKNSKFKQGVFVPKNKDKFIGSQAFYRSSLELRFMKFCDNNPNVLKWGSENIIIPYVSPADGKVHKYYVDNFVKIREGTEIKFYLIEIKPYSQCFPPQTKYKRKSNLIYEQTMYIKNQAKWSAAYEYCKKRGICFKILTEKDLLPYK